MFFKQIIEIYAQNKVAAIVWTLPFSSCPNSRLGEPFIMWTPVLAQIIDNLNLIQCWNHEMRCFLMQGVQACNNRQEVNCCCRVFQKFLWPFSQNWKTNHRGRKYGGPSKITIYNSCRTKSLCSSYRQVCWVITILSYCCLEPVVSEIEHIKFGNCYCKVSRKLKQIISHYNR